MESHANPFALFARGPNRADDHLDRARRLLERAIRARWAAGMLNRDPDGNFSALLGPAEIERLMHPPAQTGEPVTDYRYDLASPVAELISRLGLQPTEADLLAVLLAVETDPAAARLAAYLAGMPNAFSITIDTLFDIVYRPRSLAVGHAASLLYADLAADSPARRLRFLLVDGADSRPFLAQGVRLHSRITGWLLGRHGLDSELTANARLLPPQQPRGE